MGVAIRLDGARRPRFLGRNFVLNSVEQENAGRTPCGVHMAVGCYDHSSAVTKVTFSVGLAPVIVEGRDHL